MIVLSFLSIFLSAIVIMSGVVAMRISPIPNSPRVISQFHDRLGSRVGTVYDAEMHRELTSLIASNERTIDASIELFNSFGRHATTTGIFSLVSSLVSALLVFRTYTIKTQTEQDAPSNR